jgi:cobaltochelatase CobN
MHVIFRETHGMEEIAIPQDLGQSPADLVVLSFSDSDLGAFAGGWHKARAQDADFPHFASPISLLYSIPCRSTPTSSGR